VSPQRLLQCAASSNLPRARYGCSNSAIYVRSLGLPDVVSELDLSHNRFCGRLPLAIGCLKPSLTYMDISHNDYTPAEVVELREFLTCRLTAAAPNIFV